MATAIRIENLWKEYRLGVIGHGTLTQDLQSWWARMRGQEDPNSKITLISGHEKQIEGNRFWALRDINLEIEQGEVFFANGATNKHFFRLGFSSIPQERIEPGIEQLAKIVHELTTKTES